MTSSDQQMKSFERLITSLIQLTTIFDQLELLDKFILLTTSLKLLMTTVLQLIRILDKLETELTFSN